MRNSSIKKALLFFSSLLALISATAQAQFTYITTNGTIVINRLVEFLV